MKTVYGRASRSACAKIARNTKIYASSPVLSGYAVCKNLQAVGATSARLWVLRDMFNRLGLGSDCMPAQSLAALEASRCNLLNGRK